LVTSLDAANTQVALKGTLEQVVGSQSYSISGVAYKGALLSHIIKEHFRSGQTLKYLDQGGGYGLLTVELLLNKGLNIAKGVTCDINPKNEALAFQLFTEFRQQLEKRFFFETVAAQDFEYGESFDVISYVGSLLYVPKDKTQNVLKKAWNALNPGGVLIIHENIKQTSYVRDYEVMFTVEELDELLSQFGEVKRYLSTAASQIRKEAAASKSVFRVVQKQAL
jgi:SAM-dependent methyltransferase